MATTLASIHNVDVEAVGLGGFSKSEDYIQRQIRQWGRQYQANRDLFRIVHMDELLRWLPTKAPVTARIGLVHGDFRLDNIIFDKDSLQPLAVLDWELSALGDAMCDVAYNCMNFLFPPSIPSLGGVFGLDLTALGIPVCDRISLLLWL